MYEINLVPDVKLQMIKMQKVRNLVLFICLIIIAALAGVLLVLGSIKGGQDIAMHNQDSRLSKMSETVMNYEGLNEFLTIQDQLDKISQLGKNKNVLSRVFSMLTVFLPGKETEDEITISELTVNLETTMLTFDGQANAGEDPDIDYRVLEAFKKSVALTKYDYGRYVNANGEEIPTRCIIETDEDGNLFTENGNIYAYWTKSEEGCDPSRQDLANEEDYVSQSDEDTGSNTPVRTNVTSSDEKIWRTPQFDEWYKKGYISVELSEGSKVGDATIANIAHFESECIAYTGTVLQDNSMRWMADNECMLAPNGVEVRDSSNGRDSEGELVLRFSAAIKVEAAAFSFKNKHVMAIGPSGQNVTDSYVQIEGMFSERAADCAEGDLSCSINVENTGSNQ